MKKVFANEHVTIEIVAGYYLTARVDGHEVASTNPNECLIESIAAIEAAMTQGAAKYHEYELRFLDAAINGDKKAETLFCRAAEVRAACNEARREVFNALHALLDSEGYAIAGPDASMAQERHKRDNCPAYFALSYLLD